MTWNYNRLTELKPDPQDSLLTEQDKRWKDQKLTCEMLLSKFSSTLSVILGDEVGMGKTWIGLLTALSVAKEKRVLILTPNKVLSAQWCEQFYDLIKNKFSEDKAEYYRGMLIGEGPYGDFLDLLEDAKKVTKGIFVTSFNSIDPTDPRDNYARRLKEDGFFELLVIDEGHKFKNSFTEKYQIFEVTSDKRNFKAPLKNKFKRLLLMTATPFQLSHHDLKIILGIAKSTSESDEMKSIFNRQIDTLIECLNNYKIHLEAFEKRFGKLKSQEEVDLLEKIVEGTHLGPVKSSISDASDQFKVLMTAKEALNAAMRVLIIRNTKSKDKRKQLPKPIQISDEAKLTFFLGDSLQKIKSREAKSHHQGSILTSSFSRFEDLYKTETSTISQQHYSNLLKDLKDQAFKELEHPKMDMVINHAFDNWLKGDKTLIFAFYSKTIDELNTKMEKKISDFVEIFKKKFPKQETDQFLNDISNSDSIKSLVFRDNPFHVTLYPLLQKTYTKDGIKSFLKLSDSETQELLAYLSKIKYPKTNHNYFKLLTALSHVYFRKFLKVHPEAISANSHLKDDFEELCNPEASLFKKIFKLAQTETAFEESSFKRQEVPENLRSILADQEKIQEIVMYPTIWEKHKDKIESLPISTRLALTEVVWSYLTTDEFIFMDLLNGRSSIPNTLDFPEMYAVDNLPMRESTFKKIERLLDNAYKMDERNLENLLSDIAYRYNPNKRNVGRIIVETVSGENSAEEKHRSVTAFKTPLAPNILISSPVLCEGVDLHKECNDIVHYDHEWNPANLEQKIGRLDRVGSKGEAINKIDIHYPFLAGTQDEKAFNIVMARKSWFGAVMGEKYEDKWKTAEGSTALVLPELLQHYLVMKLGND